MGDQRSNSRCLSNGARSGLNVISAISPRGQMRFMVLHGRVNAAVMCQFVYRRMQGAERSVFLILDGHPAHKAKKLREHIESFQSKLRAFFLPAYAPQLNPDELVWNAVRSHGIDRMTISGPDELKSQVLGCLRHLQKSPEKIRGFFQAPTTRHAA
jgi:transposase